MHVENTETNSGWVAAGCWDENQSHCWREHLLFCKIWKKDMWQDVIIYLTAVNNTDWTDFKERINSGVCKKI